MKTLNYIMALICALLLSCSKSTTPTPNNGNIGNNSGAGNTGNTGNTGSAGNMGGTGGTGTTTNKPPIVIGADNVGASYKKNADGSYSLTQLNFSNLSTGSDLKFQSGNGIKIFYRNNKGSLSLETLYGETTIAVSNPLSKDVANIVASDTSAITDNAKNIGIGFFEIDGINAAQYGTNRLLVIPTKTGSSTSAHIGVFTGFTPDDFSSTTSDMLLKANGTVAVPQSMSVLSIIIKTTF